MDGPDGGRAAYLERTSAQMIIDYYLTSLSLREGWQGIEKVAQPRKKRPGDRKLTIYPAGAEEGRIRVPSQNALPDAARSE
jgi:hypothetical protein